MQISSSSLHVDEWWWWTGVVVIWIGCWCWVSCGVCCQYAGRCLQSCISRRRLIYCDHIDDGGQPIMMRLTTNGIRWSEGMGVTRNLYWRGTHTGHSWGSKGAEIRGRKLRAAGRGRFLGGGSESPPHHLGRTKSPEMERLVSEMTCYVSSGT